MQLPVLGFPMQLPVLVPRLLKARGGGAEWETPGPEFSNGLVRTPFEPKPELGPSSPGRNHGIRHAFSGPQLLAKMMPILQKWRQADPYDSAFQNIHTSRAARACGSVAGQ